MKCNYKGCKGNLEVIKTWYIIGNIPKRRRLCDTCEFSTTTIEVDADKYDRMRRLVSDLKLAIHEYVNN